MSLRAPLARIVERISPVSVETTVILLLPRLTTNSRSEPSGAMVYLDGEELGTTGRGTGRPARNASHA